MNIPHINILFIEMDFSADESNNSTSSSQMSSSNGDSVSSKTVHNGKPHLISLSNKILTKTT